MATKTFEELQILASEVRDEVKPKANTAKKIGNLFGYILEYIGTGSGGGNHITINGDVTNFGDEEDITNVINEVTKLGVLKFKDRSNVNSQLGYRILRKDKSIIESIDSDNTIYEIRYNFDLGGETLDIPSNCVLYFNGGVLSNGTLNGNGTRIISSLSKIFNENIKLSGVFDINEIYPEWFGAMADGYNDDTEYIQKAIYEGNAIQVFTTKLNGIYKISSTVYLPKNSGIVGNKETNGYFDKKQLVAEFAEVNSWIIDSDTYKDEARIDYRGVVSGAQFDNGTVTNCSNIFVKNLGIESKNNIYGGVRFMAAPGCLRQNVGVTGVMIGFSAYACWNILDDRLFCLAALYGAIYGNDINGLTLKDSYLNNSGAEVDLTSANAPSIIHNIPDYDIAGYHGYYKTAIYCRYINSAVFNNVITEHWQVGRIFLNTKSLSETSPYLENISECLFATAQSTIRLFGLTGVNSSTKLDFAFGANSTTIIESVSLRTYNVSQYAFKIITMNCNINSSKAYNLDVRSGTYSVSDSEGLNNAVASAKAYETTVINITDGSYTLTTKDLSNKHIIFNGKSQGGTILKVPSYNSSGFIGIGNYTGDNTILRFRNMTINLGDNDTSYTDVNDKGWLKLTGENKLEFISVTLNLNNANLIYTPWNRLLKVDFIANYLTITTNKGAMNNTHENNGWSLHNSFYVNLYIHGITKPETFDNMLFRWAKVGVNLLNGTVSTPDAMNQHRYSSGNIEYSNGAMWFLAQGATSSRPTYGSTHKGIPYFDTTLGKPIWWTGTKWVDAYGTTV